MLFTWAMVAAAGPVAEVSNGGVRVRAIRSGGEVVEELAARDRSGAWRTVLVSPTHPSIRGMTAPSPSLLRGTEGSLFDAAPSFHFGTAIVSGRTLTLTASSGAWRVVKRIELPATGKTLQVTLTADTPSPYPQIRYFLDSYAFAPGTPDETWAPALRPGSENVIGDHFFRAPAAVARKGNLAATLMPDLDTLAENRPIPTILDLDVASGVVKVPLLSYGFCDHRLSAHVRFSTDASMVRPVPWHLALRHEIRLDADAKPASPLADASRTLWDRYGHRYFERVLPQTMPFADYARLCYPAAFSEKMTGGWFERTIDGQVCGGLPSGWGLDQGWVSWQCWFNQLRSAWGLRWWGKRLGERDWVERADKMLNLALAAPMNHGAVPSTYLSRTNEWRGSLIQPTRECYYDVPSIAWKGIWLLRWLQFDDCPRRAEVRRQVDEMQKLMLRIQRPDGSFPSWLDKDLKPVPVLDRSAQSALPAWFIGEKVRAFSGRLEKFIKGMKDRPETELRKEFQKAQGDIAAARPFLNALRDGAVFLSTQVVPQRRYYDFETFFSCSPKECRQVGGVLDDRRMWDPHTMQPPQNTLCMQWAAEAIALQNQFGKWTPHDLGKDDEALSVAALSALDTMSMYQNVWPISYRKAAYTYGGFGVQNSDGEYNDARQAQFGATLCDFGVRLNRPDLFERGVAAVRASLTLVNVPNDPFHVYRDPNYPPGLEPENTGHGGTDERDGRTGFDWGEGSGLAAAAELIDRYGEGWHGIKIDAVPVRVNPVAPLRDPVFDFSQPRLPGWNVEGSLFAWPSRSNRMDFGNGGRPFIGTCEDGHGGFDDALIGTMTSPAFVSTTGTIRLLVGGGSGEGVGVELIDADGKRLAVARGRNTERMHEVTCTVPADAGPLRIRIFDHETAGWGHINVGSIHA